MVRPKSNHAHEIKWRERTEKKKQPTRNSSNINAKFLSGIWRLRVFTLLCNVIMCGGYFFFFFFMFHLVCKLFFVVSLVSFCRWQIFCCTHKIIWYMSWPSCVHLLLWEPNLCQCIFAQCTLYTHTFVIFGLCVCFVFVYGTFVVCVQGILWLWLIYLIFTTQNSVVAVCFNFFFHLSPTFYSICKLLR